MRHKIYHISLHVETDKIWHGLRALQHRLRLRREYLVNSRVCDSACTLFSLWPFDSSVPGSEHLG